ncbi:GNAT family N-acetyltransferase [Clostridium sp. BNL1100]|uniref:GNAT family N-acetyltransferase n=1 Tax=Clostridium sp. BNL1100 TaxID=755731 RepID=UPI00024A73EC|nr:GNAT family N-acetyltransferase [Clostridium sp. BNL1100]AEY66829.1 putative HD superfamily hydrolase [Clostridium sp. BNL1100]
MKDYNRVIDFIKEIEKLKNVTRTAWTSEGKQESVAEHSWRLAVFSLLLAEYFPYADMAKILGICLVHDCGEIYEGDVSAKFETDPEGKLNREERALITLTNKLSDKQRERVFSLWKEYSEAVSQEAKLVKALDKMETIIQHNQGLNPVGFDYKFNLNYGADYAGFNENIKALRKIIDRDTAQMCVKSSNQNFAEIILRELELKDLEDYLYWNHPSHEFHKFNGPYFEKNNEEELIKEIDEMRVLLLNGHKNVLTNQKIIADKDTDELIGRVNWYWKSKDTLWMEVGIVIFNEKYWGHGIGYKALKMWINEIFDQRHELVRIGVSTWSGNEWMIKLAEKLGMKREAVYRKARIVDNKYYDSVSYGILREEWQ